MNDVQIFDGLKVKEENGQIMFDAESVAIGVGISTIAKSGNVTVRWSRVNEYLGISPNVAKIKRGDWISEPQFYKLAIKANNDTANRFQDWVTEKILPSIRKTGSYALKQMTPEDQIALLATGNTRLVGRVDAVETKVDDLTERFGLPSSHAKQLEKVRKKYVVMLLGGFDSNAYAKMSGKVFAEIGRDFKDRFNLPRYDALPMSRFDEAIEYLEHWQLPTNLGLEVRELNAQTALEV